MLIKHLHIFKKRSFFAEIYDEYKVFIGGFAIVDFHDDQSDRPVSPRQGDRDQGPTFTTSNIHLMCVLQIRLGYRAFPENGALSYLCTQG